MAEQLVELPTEAYAQLMQAKHCWAPAAPRMPMMLSPAASASDWQEERDTPVAATVEQGVIPGKKSVCHLAPSQQLLSTRAAVTPSLSVKQPV